MVTPPGPRPEPRRTPLPRPTPLLALLALFAAPGAATALEGLPVLHRCGERTLEATPTRDGLELLAGFDRHTLLAVPAASGTRFEKPGDPSTWFHGKGERALVSLAGTTLPECRAEPFRASGNEPFWRLVVEEAALLLDRLGEPPLRLPRPVGEVRDGRLRLEAVADGRRLEVTIAPGLCRDTMTGMPHPARVALVLDGRPLEGCGGDPGALLRRADWTVRALDGAPLPAQRPLELRLGTEGRFAGQAPCNRIMGSWRLDGEGLRLGPVASTMMACAAPVMAAERRYVEALEAVRGFAPGEGAGLELRTASGGRIELQP